GRAYAQQTQFTGVSGSDEVLRRNSGTAVAAATCREGAAARRALQMEKASLAYLGQFGPSYRMTTTPPYRMTTTPPGLIFVFLMASSLATSDFTSQSRWYDETTTYRR